MKHISEDMLLQKLLDDIPKTSMELELCFNHRIHRFIIAWILNKSDFVVKIEPWGKYKFKDASFKAIVSAKRKDIKESQNLV